jgi:hypothetical protein
LEWPIACKSDPWQLFERHFLVKVNGGNSNYVEILKLGGKYKCIVTVRSMYLDKHTRQPDISDISCQIDTMLMNGDDRMDDRMALTSSLNNSVNFSKSVCNNVLNTL